MGLKTYFILLQGSKSSLMQIVVDVLPGSRVLWAGVGDWVVEVPWSVPPTSGKVWDLALVLETEHHHHHVSSKLKAHIDLYSTEVVPTEWEPSKEEMKRAEVMEPKNEPKGIMEVWHHNWRQTVTVTGIVHNLFRVVRIFMWLLACLMRWNLFQPFHMINLLKFQVKGEKGRDTYEEYRDEAGKHVIERGGHLAFMGDVKSNVPGSWDEVMVVAYKSRWQFFQMLLTPSYWPLAMLRDEGLYDGMLFAVEPISTGD